MRVRRVNRTVGDRQLGARNHVRTSGGDGDIKLRVLIKILIDLINSYL